MNKGIVIIGNAGKSIFNAEYFSAIAAGDKAVLGSYPGVKESAVLARYDDSEQARFAVGLLLDAMRADEQEFEFPHKNDLQDRMEYTRQHRSKTTSRTRSHGGS